jgi:RNase adapter protein RapZ
LLNPLRRWADHVIDTTAANANELRLDVRSRFGDASHATTTLSVMSFGFAKGLPRNADLVFDMRFLRNPHWDNELRPMSGQDAAVGTHIAADPAYEDAVTRVEDLLLLLLPRYEAEGKAYVTVAFGCTGGRHRSVHVAERVASRLRDAGFSPTVTHRDLGSRPDDMVEGVRMEDAMTTTKAVDQR